MTTFPAPEAGTEPAKVFHREDAPTEFRQVPFSRIVIEPETWAFRDEQEYDKDNPSIKHLAESIRLDGFQTPWKVAPFGDKYSARDCHRRYAATSLLVDGGHLPPDVLVPVEVFIGQPSKLEILLRIGSVNIERRNWDEYGEIAFAVALLNERCPKNEIARVLGKSEKQVERYLLIGQCDWMLTHIQDHNITATRAADLLTTANKYSRIDEFRDEFEAWVEQVKLDLKNENRKRERDDRELLSGDKLWPQRYMKPAVVKAWKIGITTGKWGAPQFRYRAAVERDDTTGRKTIVIDSLRVDADRLTAAETAKVYQRTYNLALELEPMILEKRQREALSGESSTAGVGNDEASRRLASLGIGDLLVDDEESDGELDEDFDDVEERPTEDLTSTAILPNDPGDDGRQAGIDVKTSEVAPAVSKDDAENSGGAAQSTIERASKAPTTE
jgi:hypothetical protein